MAYWAPKWFMLMAKPDSSKSQPMGFWGRREATIAPTVTSMTMSVLPNHQSKMWVFGSERFRAKSTRASAVSAKESAHTDHASQAVER